MSIHLFPSAPITRAKMTLFVIAALEAQFVAAIAQFPLKAFDLVSPLLEAVIKGSDQFACYVHFFSSALSKPALTIRLC